jgi:hypothetical protein
MLKAKQVLAACGTEVVVEMIKVSNIEGDDYDPSIADM